VKKEGGGEASGEEDMDFGQDEDDLELSLALARSRKALQALI
jgi:hypothetical protein